MALDAITAAVGSLAVATVSLAVSAANAWLTIWRRGTLRMAQPPTVYFGPDGARELHQKIFIRCFLYSTSARRQCVESMYARVHRGDRRRRFPSGSAAVRAMTWRAERGWRSARKGSRYTTTSYCRETERPTSFSRAGTSSSCSRCSSVAMGPSGSARSKCRSPRPRPPSSVATRDAASTSTGARRRGGSTDTSTTPACPTLRHCSSSRAETLRRPRNSGGSRAASTNHPATGRSSAPTKALV